MRQFIRHFPAVRRIAAVVLTGAFLAVSPSWAEVESPDLRAASVNGPGQANVDSTVLATINIENLGLPFTGNYVAEVVLSEDLFVDPSDVVVATIIDDFVGPQSVVCSIPYGVPDVPHIWGLRVFHPDDENPANDWTIGPFINILFVDLALDDPAPITAVTQAFGPKLAPIPVRVNNVGTPGGILVFCVEDMTPAPWLTLDPPDSFAVGGLPGNDIFLTVDHAGMLPGTYSTTLRFTNIYHEEDFEDLQVSLDVGPAMFHPGQKIHGQISTPGDEDELVFDGVKGMKLMLRVRSPSGDLKPRISILDGKGTVTSSVTFKHSAKWVKKVLKLTGSGRCSMRVDGVGDTTGHYAILTHRRMPKKGRAHVKKFKGLPVEGEAVAEALILPGGVLEYAIRPNPKFAGPIGLGLMMPSGHPFDLSGAASGTPSGGVIVEGLEIGDECGRVDLSITGFGGGPKEKLKVLVLPWQPQQAKGKIYLD